MNCETVGMMQNNKTVRACVLLLVLSVLLRSDALSDDDDDDVSVDKNLGESVCLESDVVFSFLFFLLLPLFTCPCRDFVSTLNCALKRWTLHRQRRVSSLPVRT